MFIRAADGELINLMHIRGIMPSSRAVEGPAGMTHYKIIGEMAEPFQLVTFVDLGVHDAAGKVGAMARSDEIMSAIAAQFDAVSVLDIVAKGAELQRAKAKAAADYEAWVAAGRPHLALDQYEDAEFPTTNAMLRADADTAPFAAQQAPLRPPIEDIRAALTDPRRQYVRSVTMNPDGNTAQVAITVAPDAATVPDVMVIDDAAESTEPPA